MFVRYGLGVEEVEISRTFVVDIGLEGKEYLYTNFVMEYLALYMRRVK